MSLLYKFLDRYEFDSYEDMKDNFHIKIPENFNFAYDVVDVLAEQSPDKTALIWCDDNGGEKIISFSEMKQYSERAAACFRDLGINRGDAVMLILKGRYEFWFCLLGLHRIGAIAIPATHMLTDGDIEYRVKSADIKMVVSIDNEELMGHIDKAQERCDSLLAEKAFVGNCSNRQGWTDMGAAIENAPSGFKRPSGADAVSNDDILLLYFTSGTTGFPKMVQHNYTYPLGHILTAGYWQNVKDGGLHYTVADTGWAKAVWGKIYGQWICGSSVFVYDYEIFNPHKMLEKIQKYGITTFCAPPTVYRFLINEDLSGYDLSSLKYCVVAGEPLNPEVYDKFLSHTGIRLMEGYGQTELTVTIATYPWMDPKPGSMGKPSPGYSILLINTDGNPCEEGEEGEIVLDVSSCKPVGMFDGYFRDSKKTVETWHDNLYYTGDMAWMDEDGFLWFVGRADDVIKSSGYKIGPFEVENALMQHPSVLECAITAVPDPVRGQVVKATILLKKDFTASDDLKKNIQDHVKQITAPYKYPRIIEFVDELPKTISGKIRRVEIRDRDTSDNPE